MEATPRFIEKEQPTAGALMFAQKAAFLSEAQSAGIRKQNDEAAGLVQEIREKFQLVRARQWLKHGDRCMARGEWQNAREEYQNVTAHPEWNALGWDRKAKRKTGETAEYAIPYAWKRIAEAEEKLGLGEMAVQAREKAEGLGDEIALFKAGRDKAEEAKAAKDAEGKGALMAEARDFFTGAIELNPESSLARLELVRLHEAGKEFTDAAKAMDELLNGGKPCPEALAYELRHLLPRDPNAEGLAAKQAKQRLNDMLETEKEKPFEVEDEQE